MIQAPFIRLSAILLLLAATPLCAQGTPKGQARPATAGKAPAAIIGVVDIRATEQATKAYQAWMVEDTQRRKAYQADLKKREAAISQMQEEIKTLQPSPTRTSKRILLEGEKTAYKTAAKEYQNTLARLQLMVQPRIQRELEAAIAELAKARGLVLVLRHRRLLSMEELRKSNPRMTLAEAARLYAEARQRQTVLFHGPSVDITGAVVKLLKK